MTTGIAAVVLAAVTASVALSFSSPAHVSALDAGPLVRQALPIVVAIHHLALAMTVGSLLLAAFVVPRRPGPVAVPAGECHGANRFYSRVRFRLIWVASIAAIVWVGFALLTLILTYATVIGRAQADWATLAGGLNEFVISTTVGGAWVADVIIAAVVAILALSVQSQRALTLTLILALTAVVPLSLTGHASTGPYAFVGVGALSLHWLAALVWAGGVAALALLAPLFSPRGGERLAVDMARPAHILLTRFSAIAGVAFALVVISGVVNSILRLGGWDGVFTGYGLLLVVKTAATGVLGIIGYAHRRWSIPALARTDHPGALVWRLLGVEVFLMAAVIGVAIALARTPMPM